MISHIDYVEKFCLMGSNSLALTCGSNKERLRAAVPLIDFEVSKNCSELLTVRPELIKVHMG